MPAHTCQVAGNDLRDGPALRSLMHGLRMMVPSASERPGKGLILGAPAGRHMLRELANSPAPRSSLCVELRKLARPEGARLRIRDRLTALRIL